VIVTVLLFYCTPTLLLCIVLRNKTFSDSLFLWEDHRSQLSRSDY
jgi:hypothetical protein